MLRLKKPSESWDYNLPGERRPYDYIIMSSIQPPIWPLFSLVIFDCDSTLTAVEGIDELARLAGNQNDLALSITSLTKRAMEGDIPLETVYGQRLVSVNPTKAQVTQIASLYRETAIPDARAVIEALQALGVVVFIVSGGLIEPVREFGAWLGVPRERIYAVEMEYDQLAGQWWRYWEEPDVQNPSANYLAVEASPLTGTLGKNRVIASIRAENPGRALLVGDGLSDLEASSEVDLFIGFGGAVYRPRIASEAPIYIHTPSLAPVLPLALGKSGNDPRFAPLWAAGLSSIFQGEVTFRDAETRTIFLSAIKRASRT
jgi:phosphoserine phosphatase